MENQKKLNIGCGWGKMKDFINIDKAKEVNPNEVVNIEEGLPFPDNYFSYIYSEHCLEHIRPEYWKFVLNEIARVAKNDCMLELKLPFDNIYSRTNSDHYRTFHWTAFSQNLKGSNREYYSDLVLEWASPPPNRLIRLLYVLFPIFFNEVHFKFKIKK